VAETGQKLKVQIERTIEAQKQEQQLASRQTFECELVQDTRKGYAI
jgi:hypothetical protein